MKNYTTYIFDLDGTITDTTQVWLGICRDGLLHCDVTPPKPEVLSQYTHDWKEMIKLGLREEHLDKFTKYVHRIANERLPQAPLHVGAYEMLERLKKQGKRIAIFSTLDRPIFEPAMKYRNLYAVSEVSVAGTDVPHRKPHPAGILKVLSDLDVAKEEYSQAVYIGDKDTDIQAANNAGIDAVLYYPPSHQKIYRLDDLKKHHPAAVITDWQELFTQ